MATNVNSHCGLNCAFLLETFRESHGYGHNFNRSLFELSLSREANGNRMQSTRLAKLLELLKFESSNLS